LQYKAVVNGIPDEIWFFYLATNTEQNAVFEGLSEGNEVTVCYYTSNAGDNSPVYVETQGTFEFFGPNTGSNPLQMWVRISGSFFTNPPRYGDYPTVIKSPFINNGFKPITTGQALIYDQTTDTWRPEDIAAELNISALPLLP
jgi:hypothetical protein